MAAFKAGSLDFLEKPFGTKDIEAAMRQALNADREARENAARTQEEEAARSDILGRIDRLTPRERQVMDLVVSGKPNRVIAEELGRQPERPSRSTAPT